MAMGISITDANGDRPKRHLSLYAWIFWTLLWPDALRAQDTTPEPEVTDIATLRATAREDYRARQVTVEGILTFVSQPEYATFLQDGASALYLPNSEALSSHEAGDRVTVTGDFLFGDRDILPKIYPQNVELHQRNAGNPDPVLVPDDFLERAPELDSNWGRIEIDVEDVTTSTIPAEPHPLIVINGRRGPHRIQARLLSPIALPLARAQWLGARIQVDGALAYYRENDEAPDLRVWCPTEDLVTVTQPPHILAQSYGLHTIDAILRESVPTDALIRVRGRIAGLRDRTVAIVDGAQTLLVDYPTEIAFSNTVEPVECFGRLTQDAAGAFQLEGFGSMRATGSSEPIQQRPMRIPTRSLFSEDSRRVEYVTVTASFLYNSGAAGESVFFRLGSDESNVFGLEAPGAKNHDWTPNASYRLTGIWIPQTRTLLSVNLWENAELMGVAMSPQRLRQLMMLAIGLLVILVLTLLLLNWLLARSQRALRATYAELKAEQSATLDTTTEGVLITALDGTVRNFNQRFREIWAIPDSESTRGVCEQLKDYAEALVTDNEAFWKALIRTTEDPTLETWDDLALRNGRIIERHSRPQSLEGRPTGRIWRFRDVTTREEERMRLKAILEGVAEAILGADSEGKVRLFNPAALTLFQREGSQVAGVPISELLDVTTPSVEGSLTVTSAKLTDGQRIPIEVSASSGASSASELRTYVIRDIRQRLEEEERRAALEKREKEAEKLAALGSLAGGVAHDFNNILGSMLLNARYLQKSSQDSKTAEAIADVIEAGEQAKELVTQVLTFSRQDEAAKRSVELPPVIEASIRDLRKRFPEKVALVAEGVEGDRRLWGNAAQLRQLVTNLAQNAIQALMEAKTEKGRVMIRLAPKNETRELILEVADNGPGIPPETLKRVFDPFFTTKAPGKGVGLGLSVAHGVTKAHGGSIEVTSSPERGTVFRMTFPELDGNNAPS